MATTPTQLPVPSEKPQDLKFNAGKIDEFVTSMGWTYTDRFGNKHYTIAGINYLAQQVMNAFGYITLTGVDFDTGATVNTPNEVLFNPGDNSYYKWTGSFASGGKVVPQESTPESTGGIGPGKWINVGDTALRSDLASNNSSLGSSLIGTSFGTTVQQELDYTGGKVPSPSNIAKSVKAAIDRLTERVVYAELYGIVADGVTNNTDALSALSIAVTAMTDPIVRVVFPQGVIICGKQEQSGVTGAGYSFRPTYESTGLRGYLAVYHRAGKTILDGYGTTLKLADGMKTGSFDPVTGAIAPDQTSTTPNSDYKAYAGHGIAVAACERVEVIGFELNGSATAAVVGGKYGDNGWQCDSFGIWAPENDHLKVADVKSHDWPLDSIYLTQNSSWKPGIGKRKSALIEDCELYNSRRQGISLAGGEFIDINRCIIRDIGSFASGAGSFYSAPGACIDIETEGSSVRNVTVRNTQMINSYYTLLAKVVDTDSFGCTLSNCYLQNNSDYTSILTAISDLVIINCTLAGGGIDSHDITNSTGSYPRVINSSISNNINGVAVATSRILGKFSEISGCTFRALLSAQYTPVLSVTAPQYPSNTGFTGNSKFVGNMLTIYGDKNTAPKNGAGFIVGSLIYGMQGMDLAINDGTTGTGKCLIQIDGSTSNPRGVTANSANIINKDGNSIAVDGAIWVLPGTDFMLMQQSITPAAPGGSIGNSTHRFGTICLSSGGIDMTSANGTAYILTVSNAGSLVITAK